MRLSKIKLAGFKSFLDPTTIHFPSNLIGVVGPNGCGKSNVIDAVRWVMGESSARHLRGDSMADVIFNGSSARKPVGHASIELVFDNSDGTIAGQYAGYNEISIKRIVSRDGTSLYYLNNTRCRRKDITHIFLGTGLGARSYSIIEQGMISRLVEAKPEELRVYLEEAAGISKYKERRRETENRIRHTKDNLSRLNDLRDEVDKQLKHLQRQARTARRYQKLKEEERLKGAELLALRLRDLDSKARAKEAVLAEHETAMQAALAAQRAVEATIARTRERHAERSEAFSEVQGCYYRVGAEIARLEQAIQHGRELRQRQQEDLEQTDQGLSEICSHIDRDRDELSDINRTLGLLGPDLEHAKMLERQSSQALREAEDAMHGWQLGWEEYNTQAQEAHQVTHVERTRIEHLEGQLERLASLRDKLAAERDALSLSDFEGEMQEAVRREDQEKRRVGRLQKRLERTVGDIDRLRAEDEDTAAELDRSRSALQQTRGRLASLEALQQAALGQGKGAVTDWLASRELADRPRLAQDLAVEAGWEKAVETVLGSYLEAVCVDGIDAVAAMLDSLEQGSVAFLESPVPDDSARPPRDSTDLLSKVDGNVHARALLENVLIADSLEEALSQRRQLASGESVITAEGIWLGKNWLRVSRDEDEYAGVIERENELRVLRESAETTRCRAERLEAKQHQIRDELGTLEKSRATAQDEVNGAHRTHAEVSARLQACRGRLEELNNRLRTLEHDDHEAASQLEQAESDLTDARARLEQASTALTGLDERRAELDEQRARLRHELEEARQRADHDRMSAQEILIKVESRRSARDSANQSLERMQSQLTQFETRKSDLCRQLCDSEAPLADQQSELNELLEHRLAVENQLGEARAAVESVDTELRELEQERADREARVEEARTATDEVRLAVREIVVRHEAVAEQFTETGFDLGEIQAELPEQATPEDWDDALAMLGGRIQRLGPINLAAIDEFREQSERKEYLDSQYDDLTDALGTLETAIRKIDRETRTRFRETFDNVNDRLKSIFPRLFGGGHAYLELAGDDLLSAGVTVMARPPGKRISTIHLLSGGEKALTAVALVFAIFELHPAPFCLLDEVDAPLDDANVGRFCDIVREMSERVQFVFVTHNKTTMEMARQLTGVTMQEPGVSRLVAVDIDEAVQMAAM